MYRRATENSPERMSFSSTTSWTPSTSSTSPVLVLFGAGGDDHLGDVLVHVPLLIVGERGVGLVGVLGGEGGLDRAMDACGLELD